MITVWLVMAQHFVDSLTLSWRLSSLTSTLQSFASCGTCRDVGHSIKTIPSPAGLEDYDVSWLVGQLVHHPTLCSKASEQVLGNSYCHELDILYIHSPQRIIPYIPPDLSSSATIRSKCSLGTLLHQKVSKKYLFLDFQKSNSCYL